jgi:hypothetical protein
MDTVVLPKVAKKEARAALTGIERVRSQFNPVHLGLTGSLYVVFVLHRPRKLSYGGLASSLGRHLRSNLLLTSAFLSVPRIGSTRGTGRQEWFVFAFGTPLPNDPTRPITSFKTAWTKVRQKAGVKGRWHDNRHTLVTELAESGGATR